jgi:hypothetical protein
MNVVKATWNNGQVVLDHAADWPEGRRLVIAEEPSAEIQFMTEEDQRDDPESVQRLDRRPAGHSAIAHDA